MSAGGYLRPAQTETRGSIRAQKGFYKHKIFKLGTDVHRYLQHVLQSPHVGASDLIGFKRRARPLDAAVFLREGAPGEQVRTVVWRLAAANASVLTGGSVVQVEGRQRIRQIAEQHKMLVNVDVLCDALIEVQPVVDFSNLEAEVMHREKCQMWPPAPQKAHPAESLVNLLFPPTSPCPCTHQKRMCRG